MPGQHAPRQIFVRAAFVALLTFLAANHSSLSTGTAQSAITIELGYVGNNQIPITIAVERATYWNAGGVLWAAGTNVTATPIP